MQRMPGDGMQPSVGEYLWMQQRQLYGDPSALPLIAPEDPEVTERRRVAEAKEATDEVDRLARLVKELPTILAASMGPPVRCPDGSKGWLATRVADRIETPGQKFSSYGHVFDLWVTTDGRLLNHTPGPETQRVIDQYRRRQQPAVPSPPETAYGRKLESRMAEYESERAANLARLIRKAQRRDRRVLRSVTGSPTTTHVVGPPFATESRRLLPHLLPLATTDRRD